MILLKKCPVCESKIFNFFIECKDHSTSKEIFKIVSCETCGFKFTNPRPEEKKIGKYYESENYISHTNKKSGFFNWLYQNIRKHTLSRKASLVLKLNKNKKINLLDFGCGTGDFLNQCKKLNMNVFGVEPSKKARNEALNSFKIKAEEKTDLKGYEKNLFDTITLWHVLEHLYPLEETIKNLHRTMKNDGHLLVAVPNISSWESAYYNSFWAAWDVPIHLWHFTPSTLTRLFEKHGFVVIKKKPMLFDSFYISILSEEYKTGSKNYIKASIIGLISNIIGIITSKGTSSVLYILKKNN
tara:strand:- start:1761 stop:2654 length:894 start_codon:yes stop_codon:yes gene_type:complete